MTAREAYALAAALMGVVVVLLFAPRAGATEYELHAERTGATLRADQPNTRRLRADGEEPFASLEDCRQVIAAATIDAKLGAGWRLRCRPVAVPIERVVTR